jgi:hypothetical protein
MPIIDRCINVPATSYWNYCGASATIALIASNRSPLFLVAVCRRGDSETRPSRDYGDAPDLCGWATEALREIVAEDRAAVCDNVEVPGWQATSTSFGGPVVRPSQGYVKATHQRTSVEGLIQKANSPGVHRSCPDRFFREGRDKNEWYCTPLIE